MNNYLKILILEDKVSDVELVKLQMEDLNYRCEYQVTDKKEKYLDLLDTFKPDMIISDFNLPRFDGMKALALLRERDDLTPFIFVTGTLGEENAVEAIKSGATDFIIKQHVEQLPSAVIRAMREKIEKKSRKSISNKLLESEKNYRSLFHLSPLPMWVYEPETYRFLKVNEAAIKHYGYSHEEFQHLTIRDIRLEEDMPLVEQTIKETKDEDELFIGTFRHRKKNGEIIYVELQSTFIDQDGKKARLVTANDITEKRQAEEERKRSEQRFKALVQEGSDLISIMDREGKYLFVSDSTSSILGAPPEFYTGKSAFDFIHPEDLPSVSEQLSALTSSKQVHVKPFRFQDANNHWRWIETTATDLSDEPAVGGIVTNSKDITRLIEQEQKLKLTNERYRLAALATNDAIYDWDLKTDHVLWGEGIFTLFGHPWNKQEVPLRDWIECIHPDDRANAVYGFTKASEDPRLRQSRQEYRMAQENGSFSHVLDRRYIIRDEKGKAIRMIGAISDVSESVERETEQRLLAGISHTLGQQGAITDQLEVALELLKDHGGLSYAEAWLTNIDYTRMNLVARANPEPFCKSFAEKTNQQKELEKGRDFSGKVWKAEKVLVWKNISSHANIERQKLALTAGIGSVIGAPVLFNDQVIGVLLFFGNTWKKELEAFARLLANIGTRLGAELQRKKSEAELNRFFNISPDLLCIAGMDGYFKKVNPAFTKLLGYTQNELLDVPYLNFIHQEDRSTTAKEVSQAEGKTTYALENRYTGKDGRTVWISWTISPAFDAKLLFGVGKDITERKKAEVQLRKTNDQLKMAQQIARLGYWTYNLETGKSTWSDEVYQIWEFNPNTSAPSSMEAFLSTVHPEDRDLFTGSPEELPTDQHFDTEYRVVTPSGNLKWIFQRLILIKDSSGKPARVEGIVQDITEKKKLEKEREAILESITDGFFAVDSNWMVTYWNKAAEAILGIPKEKILQHNLWDVFEEYTAVKSYEEYLLALQNQEVRVFETHYPVLGIWVEVSVFPKGDGLSVYVKDISERKQHQYEIFKTIQETQEKERARFGRDMHDGLTQSLTAIKMNLTYFKEKLERGETRVSVLEKAIEYVNSSIKESRTISHGLLSVTLESYGLITALEEVVQNINTHSRLQATFDHNFSESTSLSKELEINIFRIVQEAINNIIKHAKATEAEILMMDGTESIQLIISDNGTGIPGLESNDYLPGAGLRNIKVRVEGFDGRVTLLNKEEGGLQINILFPKSSHL